MTERVPARVLAALLFTLSVAPAASAAPPDAEQRSRALYKQAETLANDANWKEACPLFQAAHDLNSTGGTALRTADCYEKIAKYDRALDLYQYIVDHKDTDKNPERVTLAQGRVAALRKQLGLDAAAPPPPVPPPPVPPPGPVAPKPEVEPKPLPRVPNRIPAYALFGVAGAGLVVGGVFGGLALSQASSVKAACSPSPCPQEASAKSAAETKAWVSNIGFGVGIAGAVVGVVLLATGTPKVRAAVQSAIGPGGLTLRF